MKPEVVFGLESAAWPALLLNAGGAVLRSNAAGTNTFGVALAGEAPPLSAIWSPENGQKPEERKVEVGISDEKNIEIISGLTTDDKVLMTVQKYKASAGNSGTNPLSPFGQRRSH